MEQIIEVPDLTDAELLGQNILVLGTLYEPGTEGETPVTLPGWHVNSAHAIAGWDAYRVTPATLRNVFAGVETYCYTFTDEATFREVVRAGIDPIIKPPVPEVVTALQALLAIDAFGMSTIYETWANAPERTFAEHVFIQRAKTWRRDDSVLQSAATAFGLSSEQLDGLFRMAASL